MEKSTVEKSQIDDTDGERKRKDGTRPRWQVHGRSILAHDYVPITLKAQNV